MNQTVRYGIALLLIAGAFRLLGGEDMGDVAGVLALIAVALCVVGLLRPTGSR